MLGSQVASVLHPHLIRRVIYQLHLLQMIVFSRRHAFVVGNGGAFLDPSLYGFQLVSDYSLLVLLHVLAEHSLMLAERQRVQLLPFLSLFRHWCLYLLLSCLNQGMGRRLPFLVGLELRLQVLLPEELGGEALVQIRSHLLLHLAFFPPLS